MFVFSLTAEEKRRNRHNLILERMRIIIRSSYSRAEKDQYTWKYLGIRTKLSEEYVATKINAFGSSERILLHGKEKN